MTGLDDPFAAWRALGDAPDSVPPPASDALRVLVAGVGNKLRADDAFGVEVATRLMTMDLPEGVKVVETGIGGIALVQELQAGYDALVIIDAVDRGRPAGHVMLIELDVPHVDDMEWGQRFDFLADVHLATPERALIMSKALGVLPDNTLMVGCQPVDAETPGIPMSPEVTAACDIAVREVLRHLRELTAPLGGSPPTAPLGGSPPTATDGGSPPTAPLGGSPPTATDGGSPPRSNE